MKCFALLFVLFCNTEIFGQEILLEVDPCGGKLYVLNHPSRVDTNHTYIEAVQAYFERHKGTPFVHFDVTAATELGVRIIRSGQTSYLLFVEPKGLEDTTSISVSLNFRGVERGSWYEPSSYSSLMPEVVLFSETMGICPKSVFGVPSGDKIDYIFEQAYLQNSNSHFQNVDTIIGIRDEFVLNPVIENEETYAPKAFLSADGRTIAMYLFIPQYRPVQKGNYSLMRILAKLDEPRSIRCVLLPAFVFGSYGFDYGDCLMMGFF